MGRGFEGKMREEKRGKARIKIVGVRVIKISMKFSKNMERNGL